MCAGGELLYQCAGTFTRLMTGCRMAGPALAVLVGSVGLAAPIEAWLEAEVASELGNRLGRTRVIPLPGSSQNAMETSLMAALCWAASNSPAQPQLQVTPQSSPFFGCLRVQILSTLCLCLWALQWECLPVKLFQAKFVADSLDAC